MLLLAAAIARLAPVAMAGLTSRLGPLQWLALVLWVGFMAYTEGYRGFQRSFSPRVAARARHLADHPSLTRALLAPAFCMAFFAAPRRRLLGSWLLTVAVIVFVIVVQRVPQPWRGIIDAGVVVGLGWGVITLVLSTVRAFGPAGPGHPGEVVPHLPPN